MTEKMTKKNVAWLEKRQNLGFFSVRNVAKEGWTSLTCDYKHTCCLVLSVCVMTDVLSCCFPAEDWLKVH